MKHVWTVGVSLDGEEMGMGASIIIAHMLAGMNHC